VKGGAAGEQCTSHAAAQIGNGATAVVHFGYADSGGCCEKCGIKLDIDMKDTETWSFDLPEFVGGTHISVGGKFGPDLLFSISLEALSPFLS
jgi:hypothetical protein